LNKSITQASESCIFVDSEEYKPPKAMFFGRMDIAEEEVSLAPGITCASGTTATAATTSL
jgi:hypothetical protein